MLVKACGLFVLFLSLLNSAHADYSETLDPHWQIEGHLGALTKALDKNVESKWEHETLESPMIRVGGFRFNHLNKVFFMMYGASLSYVSSKEELGSTEINSNGYSFAPEVRFGLYFPIKNLALRGYAYINYGILRDYSSELKSASFTASLDDGAEEGIWPLNAGLALSLPLIEAWHGILTYDLVLTSLSLGVALEF